MIYDILYESCPWHTRVALLNEHGKLVSMRFEDESLHYITGAVVLGRVRKVMKGLNAAFVDIGDVTDGFLPLETLPKELKNLTEGQELMVRVVRGRTEDKGARLSANVIHHRPKEEISVPYLVEEAPCAVSRSLMDAGVNPVRVWLVDANMRSHVSPYVSENQIYRLDQHEDVDMLEALDNQLEEMSTRSFALEGGASLTVEMTKALTSIDVDSGGVDIPDKSQLALSVNMHAAEEIARICRMANIGGSIIVDFISMRSKKDREKVRDRLKDVFTQTDMSKVEILEMSRFGLLEMNREKTGENLVNLLQRPSLIAGEILIKLWRQKKAGNDFMIEASPDVAYVLKSRMTTASAMAYLGKAVDIRENPALKDREYRISS